jgi:hypothetical protein
MVLQGLVEDRQPRVLEMGRSVVYLALGSVTESSQMPICPLIARLARAERLPRKEVAACRAGRDEILPVFIDVLRRAADRHALTQEEDLALVYIVHLLGEFADPAAFAPLVAFLRSDPDWVGEALGDSITETLNGILISTFDGDRGLLEDLIEDPSVDQFLRAAALEAWSWLVAAGRIDRGHAERFLAECASTRLPHDSDFIWSIWLISVAYLGVAGLRKEVKQACEDRRVDPQDINWRDFERLWAEARASADILDLLARNGWRPFIDALAEFEAWYCFSDADRREQRRKEMAERTADTVRNPYRRVGRNDPCPCGSAKQYKRCRGA